MVVELRLPRVLNIRVYCSREIAVGSVGIFGSRAKVSIGCVMLVRRRKFTYRYVMIGIGCSVDHYGLFIISIYKKAQTLHIMQSLRLSFLYGAD